MPPGAAPRRRIAAEPRRRSTRGRRGHGGRSGRSPTADGAAAARRMAASCRCGRCRWRMAPGELLRDGRGPRDERETARGRLRRDARSPSRAGACLGSGSGPLLQRLRSERRRACGGSRSSWSSSGRCAPAFVAGVWTAERQASREGRFHEREADEARAPDQARKGQLRRGASADLSGSRGGGAEARERIATTRMTCGGGGASARVRDQHHDQACVECRRAAASAWSSLMLRISAACRAAQAAGMVIGPMPRRCGPSGRAPTAGWAGVRPAGRDHRSAWRVGLAAVLGGPIRLPPPFVSGVAAG